MALAADPRVDLGASRDQLAEAISEVRGPHRVTDQNPEDKYQALEKFGRDLTEAAELGKLDPVIARDDEIRRVIQVLSRRTRAAACRVVDARPAQVRSIHVYRLKRRLSTFILPAGLQLLDPHGEEKR